MRFDWKAGKLEHNLERIPSEIDRAITASTEFAASRGESYAKVNAPWTDRTGAARSGLNATASKAVNQYNIILAHAVHYGIWLEIANSGDYQIIMPTVQVMGDILMDSLNGIIGRIG